MCIDSKQPKKTVTQADGLGKQQLPTTSTISRQHDVANQIDPHAEHGQLQDQDTPPQKVSAGKRTHYNVERNWASTSGEKSQRRNIHAPHLGETSCVYIYVH